LSAAAATRRRPESIPEAEALVWHLATLPAAEFNEAVAMLEPEPDAFRPMFTGDPAWDEEERQRVAMLKRRQREGK
jgi:hypothetical protein